MDEQRRLRREPLAAAQAVVFDATEAQQIIPIIFNATEVRQTQVTNSRVELVLINLERHKDQLLQEISEIQSAIEVIKRYSK